jgi:hypothetical protein
MHDGRDIREEWRNPEKAVRAFQTGRVATLTWAPCRYMSHARGMQYRRGCPRPSSSDSNCYISGSHRFRNDCGIVPGVGARTRVSSTLLERINFLALFGNGVQVSKDPVLDVDAV